MILTKIETRHAKEFFDFLKANAQKRIDTKNKTYLINYPQEDEQIELILETEKDETGKINIKDFLFHHKLFKYVSIHNVLPVINTVYIFDG